MSAPQVARPDDGASGRVFVPGLAAIALLALAVRVWQAGRTELWFDEIFTLWLARMDWHTMLATIARDVHPPLHFAIVKLWRALGGEGSRWIKLSSVIPGVALVATIGWTGRSMFGPRAGLFAALLVALNAEQVAMAQEARSYVWLALAVWLALGCAYRWVRDGRAADAIGLVLAEALGLWSHYLAGLVFACLFVWGVVALARAPRRVGGWIGLHLAVAVGFAPQVPTFLAQLAHSKHDHWITHTGWDALYSLARHSAFGSAILLVPFAILAVLPLARTRERSAATLVWWTILAVVGISFAATLAGGNLYTERYMRWAGAGLCLLAAAGLAGLRMRWLAALLALAFVAQGARVIAATPEAEARDEAAAGRYLERHLRAGDAIVCVDAHSLLYLRQHAPRLPGPILLWVEGSLPYYEGALVIPPAWMHGAGALDSLRAAGVSWWAVRSVHGGIDTAPGARLVERAGARVAFRAGETRVYAPADRAR